MSRQANQRGGRGSGPLWRTAFERSIEFPGQTRSVGDIRPRTLKSPSTPLPREQFLVLAIVGGSTFMDLFRTNVDSTEKAGVKRDRVGCTGLSE
jgi:hypothetical protein